MRIITALLFLPLLAYTPHESKLLRPQELAQKKTGFYATGLPVIAYDPVIGPGGGGVVNLFYNGTPDDPMWNYFAYKYMATGVVYRTGDGVEGYFLGVDAPFVGGTPFCLWLAAAYDNNPYTQFFGLGRETMRPLPSLRTGRGVDYATYERDLARTRPGNAGEAAQVSDSYYNTYGYRAATAQLFVEYNVFSAWRICVTSDITRYAIDDRRGDDLGGVPAGCTLVAEGRENGSLTGVAGGQLHYLRTGAAWDTRDFEPDPHSCLLAEVSYTDVRRASGSDYSFRKVFLQIKAYQPIWPRRIEEITLAMRSAASWTSEGAPFSEVGYMLGIDGGFSGLGGLNTLRGFRANRFAGNMMAVHAAELRTRVWKGTLLGDYFSLSIVPFVETGRVWTHSGQFGYRGYQVSGGGGLRLV